MPLLRLDDLATPARGALIVGFGDRWGVLDLDGAPDGYVLTVDSTSPCGLSWQPGGSYAAPSFTAFGISGQSIVVEVGATIGGGPETFTWSTANPANIRLNSLTIVDTTAGTTLASGLANTGSDAITLGSITHTAPASQVWTISGTSTSAVVFSRPSSVNWEWRVYAGTSSNTTLTANQVKALTDADALQASFAGTYVLSAGGYKYFAYPDSMGSVADFVDSQTGFLVSMATVSDDPAYSHLADGWYYDLVNVTNAQGVATNYRVYRSTYPLGGTLSLKVS